MQQNPEPVFLNVEYLFLWIYNHTIGFFRFLLSANFFFLLKIIAGILVILLITLILYCLVRFYELKEEDKKKEAAKTAAAAPLPQAVPIASGAALGRNETWEHIRTRLLSDNQSDWRLAIIEADIYLDKLLDQKGYHGDTIGDKLKQITPDTLGSIQIAWEAHKVRNRIAHEGSTFALTQPEVRRVLSYYEIVFRDLGAIE